MEKVKKRFNYGVIFLVILTLLTIIKVVYNKNDSSDSKATPVYKNEKTKEGI